MNLPVSFNLSVLHCHDEGDGPGDAEPYLWTIFFKIDGQTIKQNGAKLTGKATFAFGPGSHGNLGRDDVGSGDSFSIPSTLGKWSTTVSPIIIKDLSNNTYQIPGTVGVAAILMEEDNVSDSGAEAGHQALNKFIQDSINNFISSISLLDFVGVSNPQEKLKTLIADMVKKIKDQGADIVSKAVSNTQAWYTNAWSFVNKDDKIGSEIWMFNQDEIVQKRYHVSFSQRWKSEGDWEIFGEINSPNPCNGQQVAVNQQKSKIKNIEDQVRALQTEFARAAPAQKPAIKAEIDEVKKDLPPLQTELKRLEGLLNQCYTRQSIHVELSDVRGVFQ